MGFGLPAAIGAKVACPDDTVVCLSGDGSLVMTCQEMATAAHHEIPVKVFLMNNGHFGMVRQWQELFWDEALLGRSRWARAPTGRSWPRPSAWTGHAVLRQVRARATRCAPPSRPRARSCWTST